LVQLVGPLALLLLTVRLLGGHMQHVFAGDATLLSPMLRPIEPGIYRLAGVGPDREQKWFEYALALLLFHLRPSKSWRCYNDRAVP
jgi:K+-transporting ATPase ATPase A chain